MKSPSPDWGVALDRLTDRWTLDSSQRAQLATVIQLLQDDDTAPTSVRDGARAVDVHLADSLVALDLEPLQSAARVADLGAGAGFPGLPLAIARADLELYLIESQARKCRFLERVLSQGDVRNARVVCARAEEWRDGIGRSDVVIARALGPQPVVLEYAAPLLRLGGTLVDWRGRRDAAEEMNSLAAADALGLELVRISKVEPFAQARDHHLHLYRKVAATPQRFPRRAGIARKRPLGVSRGVKRVDM